MVFHNTLKKNTLQRHLSNSIILHLLSLSKKGG
jgi:hypothetical protein